MKKFTFFMILILVSPTFSSAQVLCIKCYDQNDSISANVNNLIVNGGFENTTCAFNSNYNTFCPNSSAYNCNISNWICTGGGSNTYACFYDSTFWYVQSGTHSVYFGNNFCLACSQTADDTSCIFQEACHLTGIPDGYPISAAGYGGLTGVSLEQTVLGLVPGNIYVLEFWAGGESFFGSFPQDGLFALNVGFGNNFLSCKSTPAYTGIGRRYIVQFMATSTVQTIKFTNWGHLCTTCTELVLDDVRLYTLAELSPLVESCGVGISQPGDQAGATLFPNPFTDDLTLRLEDNELTEFNLYDLASRTLFRQNFSRSLQVNTQSFPKGIYFYELKNENGLLRKGKIVKD